MLHGKVEGQRAQGINDPKTSHFSAIEGLDPDHAHDDLSRHAIDRLRALQDALVFFPKTQTGLDSNLVDEAAAVDPPVLHEACGRWLHQRNDRWRLACLPEHASNPVGRELAPLGQFAGKLHDRRPLGIGRSGADQRGGCSRFAFFDRLNALLALAFGFGLGFGLRLAGRFGLALGWRSLRRRLGAAGRVGLHRRAAQRQGQDGRPASACERALPARIAPKKRPRRRVKLL